MTLRSTSTVQMSGSKGEVVNEGAPDDDDEIEEDEEGDEEEARNQDEEQANEDKGKQKRKKSRKPKPSLWKKYSIIFMVIVLIAALIFVLYYVQREPLYLDYTIPPNITTTTEIATTTTMKATKATTRKPISTIRGYSNEKPKKADHSLYSTDILSRCKAASLNGPTVPDDPFMKNIRNDWVGNHYKPGCRYYFVMDRTKTQKEASDYCQKNGAFLAIIEDYLEECYIGHKLDSLRRSGTSVDRLWIAGETYTDQTKVLPNSRHPVYVRWSPEKPISTSSVYNHLCIYQPLSQLTAEPQPVRRLVADYNLILDYSTYGLNILDSANRDVGCWRTYSGTNSLNFICKKCIVSV